MAYIEKKLQQLSSPLVFVGLWALFSPLTRSWTSSCALAVIFWHFITQRNFYNRWLQTVPRDVRGIWLLIRLRVRILSLYRLNKPVHYFFLQTVKKYPQKCALTDIRRDKSWTFTELNEQANQIADYFHKAGLKDGDVVAIYMDNCPEFIATWLGLSKLGVVTAWINYHLKLEPLAHCIKVAEAQAIICSARLQTALHEARIKNCITRDYPIYVYGDISNGTKARNLEQELTNMSTAEPNVETSTDFKSVLCYIYTSGTTGMPKAAVMKHYRYYWIAMAGGESFQVFPSDRIYVTMPLYHTAAGILGTGQTVINGATSVIREKFSASNFWRDCVKYNCTVSQYIGEICRYLLAQPETKEEREHNIRVMIGNGLRPEIWPQFVNRFGVQRIGEFYGSTEGTSNLVNTNNHVGACGFFPIHPAFSLVNPLRLVKVDPETQQLIRDKKGLCVFARPGETGEMISFIKRRDPLFDFVGYVNKTATDKKVIRDVYSKGDEAFTSGDILLWDEYGYLYFKDRRGDSYRWKGENVSTTEVEAILQPIMTVADCTVYGVQVPGKEGRAGMAAISRNPHDANDEQHFLSDVGEHLCDNLPSYAVPVFVRLCEEVSRTGTFKLKKGEFQKDGFCLADCSPDTVFYWNAKEKRYVMLTEEMETNIENGNCTDL